MEVDQQGDHRRNFAVTKSRLQQMKHDPSISIDDFISKMFVSKDSLAGNSSYSPNLSKKSPVLGAQRPSFEPSFSRPGLESDFASDDAWDNFKSSLDTSSFTQPKATKGGRFFNFDADFDDLTLRESINHPFTPNRNLSPALDLSGQSSSNFTVGVVAPLSIPTSSHLNQTLDPPESFDEQLVSESTPQETDTDDGFEDFQACAYKSPSTVEQIQKQLPTEEWLKCLSECRSMLAESASILSSLVTDSDVDAFLATHRGNEFMLELIEIYGIIQRIRLAASLNDLLDARLQAVFNQIDRIWGDLARFVKSQDHKLTLKRRLVQSVEAATMVDPLSVEPNCGVCVTPVPASPPSSSTVEVEPGTAVISLAGRVYHASCANLWVNRIELSLPALRVR
ncbi:unnamed protein product [Taenia asiatica]|uniref:Synergin gamma n=1 Tax=Taenia asiatica TaxID=60517 RepID=A0A158R9F2_TAEAS|nr:unnamed protein product [Taenia asiatica]